MKRNSTRKPPTENKHIVKLIEQAGDLPQLVYEFQDGTRTVVGVSPFHTVGEQWSMAVDAGVFVGGERIRLGIATQAGEIVGWIGYRIAPEVFDTDGAA